MNLVPIILAGGKQIRITGSPGTFSLICVGISGIVHWTYAIIPDTIKSRLQTGRRL